MNDQANHHTGSRDGDDAGAGPPRVVQPGLPLDDEPIPFRLTARARRVVAPDALPELRVVEDAPPAAQEATDRARARALRRAGLAPDAIARRLDRDELLVRAWVDGVGAGSRSGAAGLRAVPSPSARPDPAPGVRPFVAARAAALPSARRDLTDPAVAAGVGLLVAADVDERGVTLRSDDLDLTGLAVTWLRRHLQVDRVRVVLQCGPRAAADVARHAWGRALGVAADACIVARWPDAPTPTAVRALVHVPDPGAAGRLTAWRDALGDLVAGQGDDLAF